MFSFLGVVALDGCVVFDNLLAVAQDELVVVVASSPLVIVRSPNSTKVQVVIMIRIFISNLFL